MMRWWILVFVGVMGNAGSACGPAFSTFEVTSTIAPTPTAPRPRNLVLPYVPQPAPHEGLVVVDVLEDGGRVSLVTSMRRAAVTYAGASVTRAGVDDVELQTTLLCAQTPCAFSLPLGSHSLLIEALPPEGFDATSDVIDITVSPQPLRVTHQMSQKSTLRDDGATVMPMFLELLGWTVLCLSPLPFLEEDGGVLGLGMLGGGLALVIVGAVTYDPGSSTTVRQPYATTITPHFVSPD